MAREHGFELHFRNFTVPENCEISRWEWQIQNVLNSSGNLILGITNRMPYLKSVGEQLDYPEIYSFIEFSSMENASMKGTVRVYGPEELGLRSNIQDDFGIGEDITNNSKNLFGDITSANLPELLSSAFYDSNQNIVSYNELLKIDSGNYISGEGLISLSIASNSINYYLKTGQFDIPTILSYIGLGNSYYAFDSIETGQVNIGESVRDVLGATITDDDLDFLQDSTFELNGNNYNFHDELVLGNDLTVQTSLTSNDDDYMQDIFMEAPRNSLGYCMVFDEQVNLQQELGNSSNNVFMRINFSNYELLVHSIESSSSMTYESSLTKLFNGGDSIIYEGKNISLDRTGLNDLVVVTVEGVSKVIGLGDNYNFNGINIYVNSVDNEDGIANDWATITITNNLMYTVFDGDPFIGEGENDPNWVWNLHNLTDTINQVFCIENDFDRDTDARDAVGVSEYYSYPNDFASIGMKFLTVYDLDYLPVNILPERVDLWGAGGSSDEYTIMVEASDTNSIILDSSQFTDTVLLNNILTDKIYLVRKELEGNVQVYYVDSDDDENYAGNLSMNFINSSITFAYFNYENTTGTDVGLTIQGSAIIDNGLFIGITPNEILTEQNDYYWLNISDDGVNFVGFGIESQEDNTDFMWGNVDPLQGLPKGTSQEDLRGYYGIEIVLEGYRDKFSFYVPSDILKANVEIREGANFNSAYAGLNLQFIGEDITIQDIGTDYITVLNSNAPSIVRMHNDGDPYFGPYENQADNCEQLYDQTVFDIDIYETNSSCPEDCGAEDPTVYGNRTMNITDLDGNPVDGFFGVNLHHPQWVYGYGIIESPGYGLVNLYFNNSLTDTRHRLDFYGSSLNPNNSYIADVLTDTISKDGLLIFGRFIEKPDWNYSFMRLRLDIYNESLFNTIGYENFSIYPCVEFNVTTKSCDSEWGQKIADVDSNGSFMNESTDLNFSTGDRTGIDAFALALSDLDEDGIPDYLDADSDNDNITDINDSLTGNVTDIITNFENLTIWINGTDNLSYKYSRRQLIQLKQQTKSILEFYYNFESNSKLNWRDLLLRKQLTGQNGKIVINNLFNINGTKNASVDKTIQSNTVCIKDIQYEGDDSVTETCETKNDETIIYCDGLEYNGYTCTDLGNYFFVTGLNHSIVQEQQPCNESWTCNSWTTCSSGTQTRSCYDSNICGTGIDKPIELQSCTVTTEDDGDDSSSSSSSSSLELSGGLPVSHYVADFEGIYLYNLSVGDSVIIKIGDIEYEIKATQIALDKAIVTMSSGLETLNRGQERYFDFDNSGSNEIGVLYKEYYSTKMELQIESLTAPEELVYEELLEEVVEEIIVVEEENESDNKSIGILMQILIVVGSVIVIAVLVGGFLLFKNKKNPIVKTSIKKDELSKYIIKLEQEGVSKPDIVQKLKGAGWKQTEIDKHFTDIDNSQKQIKK